VQNCLDPQMPARIHEWSAHSSRMDFIRKMPVVIQAGDQSK
jgi:hypothetical protein